MLILLVSRFFYLLWVIFCRFGLVSSMLVCVLFNVSWVVCCVCDSGEVMVWVMLIEIRCLFSVWVWVLLIGDSGILIWFW